MNKQAYITLMGRSGWAVLNSFHASVIETDYRPQEIHILCESQFSDDVRPVKQGIEIIQSSYSTPSVHVVEIPDWDARTTGATALSLVQQLRRDGFEIALDITGGRKAPVAGSLLALKNESLRHLFYLGIETTEGAAKPYLLIPKRKQKLFDITTGEVQTEQPVFDPTNAETDVVLTRECMMILLNQAYVRGERILVRAPLLGVDILEVDPLAAKVALKTDAGDYEQRRRESEFEGSDHPTYADLKRCLCYCGILNYENADELVNLLKNDISKDYYEQPGMRRNAIALDSNMFYNGFPSMLQKLERQLGIQSKDVLCVTAYPVLKEVRKGKWRKYTKEVIQTARSHYGSERMNRLLDELMGQNTLETRISKMAVSQLSTFMKRPVHLKTDEVELPSDKEQVDLLIVDSLEQFAKQRGIRVTLLSTDKNMIDHCRLAEDVGVRILRLPADIPRVIDATDETIADLLMGLSLLFGVVELEKIGYLFGEYRGKSSENYADEAKLRVHNLHRAQVLRGRTEICRNLVKLGISG